MNKKIQFLKPNHLPLFVFNQNPQGYCGADIKEGQLVFFIVLRIEGAVFIPVCYGHAPVLPE